MSETCWFELKWQHPTDGLCYRRCETKRVAVNTAGHLRNQGWPVELRRVRFVGVRSGRAPYEVENVPRDEWPVCKCSTCKAIERKLAAKPPGKITQHWLVSAYDRVCAGEPIEQVMLDFGWVSRQRVVLAAELVEGEGE